MPSRPLSPRQIELVADRFKALAEPSRLRILQALRTRERTVTELMAGTGFGQANLSKHLQVLHAAGFLTRRKEGVSVYYALADPDVFALCDLVCGRIERELAEQRRALR
jgi:ArsR family transcriptional regulator, arsenate/arsenite/antimonite-responsive transcriptional repressor